MRPPFFHAPWSGSLPAGQRIRKRVLDTELAKSLQGDAPRNGLTRRYVEGFLGRDLLCLTNQK